MVLQSLYQFSASHKLAKISKNILSQKCCQFFSTNPIQSSNCETDIVKARTDQLDKSSSYLSRIFEKVRNRELLRAQNPSNETLVVVGAGPIGLLYGLTAWEAGIENIIFLEKRLESNRKLWFDFTGSSFQSTSRLVLESWGIFDTDARIQTYPIEETDSVSIICMDIEKFLIKSALIASSSYDTKKSLSQSSIQFKFGHEVIGYCSSYDNHAMLVMSSNSVLPNSVYTANSCITGLDQSIERNADIHIFRLSTSLGQIWTCQIGDKTESLIDTEQRENCYVLPNSYLVATDILVIADGSKSQTRQALNVSFVDQTVVQFGDLLEGEWKQTDIAKTSSNFMKSLCYTGVDDAVDCVRINLELPSIKTSCCLSYKNLLPPPMKYSSALDLALLSNPRLPYQQLKEEDISHDIVATVDGVVIVNRAARLSPDKHSVFPGPREISGQEYQVKLDINVDSLTQVTMLLKLEASNDGNCPQLRIDRNTDRELSPFAPALLFDGVVSIFKRFFFGYCEIQVLFNNIIGNSVFQLWNDKSTGENELLELSRHLCNFLLAAGSDSYVNLEKLATDSHKIVLIEQNFGKNPVVVKDGSMSQSLSDRLVASGHVVKFPDFFSLKDVLIQTEVDGKNSSFMTVFQISIGRAGPRLAFTLVNPSGVSLPVMIVGDASVSAHYRLGVGINHAIEGLQDWRFALHKLRSKHSSTSLIDWLNYRMDARTTDVVRYQLFVMFFESYCEHVVFMYEVIPINPATRQFSDDYYPLTLALHNCLRKLSK